MTLAVVIVNYSSAALTIDCLRSIRDTTDVASRSTVYVVDNASPDDSVATLKQSIAAEFQDFVTLIPADRNGGFAFGNNVGIRAARQDHADLDAVLLLNPDTIVLPGAFTALQQALHEHPEAGLLGACLLNPPAEESGEPHGAIQRSAFRFPSIASEFEANVQFGPVSRALQSRVVAPEPRESPHQCDWLSGAALCIRREVLDAVGPMDERFFLYYEETDYCRRARALGYCCLYYPAAKIVHLEGQSTGVAHARPKRRPAYWFDSRNRYFIAHHGRAFAIAADLAATLGTALARTKGVLFRRPVHSPPRYARDLLTRGALRGRWA